MTDLPPSAGPAGSVLDRCLIERVVAHPMRVKLPTPQRTSQGEYAAIELVIVEIHGSGGLAGFGECLARKGARAYATFIEDVLAPMIVGKTVARRSMLWDAMRATMGGRTGGMLLEAIAGIDIAIWDLAGKAAGLSIADLLGGARRTTIPAYASSINWLDDRTVGAEVERALAMGFTTLKVKLGAPVEAAVRRAKLVRQLVGDDTKLAVDCNWAFDLPDALRLGRTLADLDYIWFEEPILPEDRQGYKLLSERLPIRLAAGECDYTTRDTRDLLLDRSLGLVQPDVARSGGITTTWQIAQLAHAFDVAYAPHVGWSGGICVAASLQLAAAAPNLMTFECMVYDNPLRQHLLTDRAGDSSRLSDGALAAPTGPGLGVEIDREVLDAFRIR